MPGITQNNQPLLGRLSDQLPDYYRQKFVSRSRDFDKMLAQAREAYSKGLNSVPFGKPYSGPIFQLNWKQSEPRRKRIAVAAASSIISKYRGSVRGKVSSFLDLGLSRGPLDPQFASPLIRTGYRVERFYFSSMPGWYVSANLYVPDAASASSPRPGILIACGHDTRAKWIYQAYAQGLCKLGYVVLIFDPVGAGERLQLPSTQPVDEHKTVGRQLVPAGWDMAKLQAWDASRGVDYLLSRPEVDPRHVGATGTSGGGTQTVWVSAIDRRVTMQVPSCFVTTFERNNDNQLWADQEQVPQEFLALGLGMSDFILAAGVPIKFIGQLLDFFDVRGWEQVVDDTERVCEYQGTPGSCQSFLDDNDHQLDADGMRAAAQFFSDLTGVPGGTVVWPSTASEPSVSDLWATATGSVSDEPGAKTSRDLLIELVDALETQQGDPAGDVLKQRVRAALRMPDEALRAAPPDFSCQELYSQWTNNGVGVAFPEEPVTAGVDAVLVAGENAAVPLNNTATDWLAVEEKTPGGAAADHFSIVRVSGSTVKVQAHNADGSLASGNTSTVTARNFGTPPAAITPPNYPKAFGCVFSVETEPGVVAQVYYLSTVSHHSPPPKVPAGTRAILYIAHLSADQELSTQGREPLVTSTIAAEPNTAFFAVDVRGVGESRPTISGVLGAVTETSGSGDDFFAEIADAFGEPLLGRRVWDVLRVIDFLASYGYTSIYLIGRGWHAMEAAHAALLDDRVVQVELKNSLTRWRAVARAEPLQQSWPAGTILRGCLGKYDLNHVYAELYATKTGLTRAFNATWNQFEYGQVPYGAWLANPAGER